MREFRVWDKRINKMKPVLEISFDAGEIVIKRAEDKIKEIKGHHCSSCDPEYDDYLFRDEDWELMQSIGYKDNNNKGKDIYQGDILLGADGTIYEVIWNKYDCGFIYRDTQDRDRSPFPNGIKIIGNIYENPEMMERK